MEHRVSENLAEYIFNDLPYYQLFRCAEGSIWWIKISDTQAVAVNEGFTTDFIADTKVIKIWYSN